jgi:3-hydroxyisobutyrate dehydrogenase-like beta-hydroxyacid dehydrogenase
MQHRPVGIIGLGLLGSGIAQRLIDAGFLVNGFDVAAIACQNLVDAGGNAASSTRQVFESCPVVFLSLPNSEIVTGVIDDATESIQADSLIVDTTTGEPDQVVAVGHRLSQLGSAYIEATVAGSSQQVRNNQATLFLGGDDRHLQRIQPYLAAVCSRQFRAGEIGSASRLKLVHNLILGLNRAVLAEGLVFAECLGFDPATILSILRQTPAASGVMDTKGAKMVTGDRTPQARLSQHLKDVRLMLAEAKRCQCRIPLTHQHLELLEHAEQLGLGDADNSAIIEVFRSPEP